MNHLLRELAPVTEDAWTQIDEEATRSLKHFLAARRLVDFSGPKGWGHAAVDLGRVDDLDSAAPSDRSRRPGAGCCRWSKCGPHSRWTRDELAAADRGATDVELDAVHRSRARRRRWPRTISSSTATRAAGSRASSRRRPTPPVPISADYGEYPEHVARAVAALRGADVAGPYGIALGPRCYTGVTETTEHGGYPVLEHIREILGGPVVWAPAVDGAVVLSLRSGDFELTVGEDFSIGYRSADETSVNLYIEESLAFRIKTAEAAVHLAYQLTRAASVGTALVAASAWTERRSLDQVPARSVASSARVASPSSVPGSPSGYDGWATARRTGPARKASTCSGLRRNRT